jgi:septal ring factor EnvC (AmiA/AmiB activator)
MERHCSLLIYRDKRYHHAAAGDVDARRSRRIVIPGEDVNRSHGTKIPAHEAACRQRPASRLSPIRTAALLLAAAFFATAWTPDAQADDNGRSGDTSARTAQSSTSAPAASQATEGQEHQTPETLARELAATKRDLEVLVRLLNKACDESTVATRAADRETAELRIALQEERDRAEQMKRDLASLRSVEPHGVSLTKASDEVSGSIRTADKGTADLGKSLKQERDRASRLEQDLATARRDVETQKALATKAGAEASQLKKTADAGAADFGKSLQQERARASRLEQDLAAARRDVETQTVLATKAGAEASQLKKTADAGAADFGKSLQQERDRASRLEQDLVTARRDVETQTALATKAGAEASQLKKTADAGAADLSKSLQQERDRASRLEQDLAAARRDVETQTALATKAGAEAGERKKTVDASSADLSKSLQQEHDRAGRLEQDLAASRRDVETQKALATKAGAEASELKKTADAGWADLNKSLQQERDRASRLEQDLAASRRDIETQKTLATRATAEASQLKKTADDSAGVRKSLQQERDRASRLEQDLGAARRDVETQKALVTKAGADASQLKKTADAGWADLRKSLQQERDRAAGLERDLALARSKAPSPAILATGSTNTQHEAEPAKPVAAEQATVADARADTQIKGEASAEVTRLVTYARVLIDRGDIGSARIVLQRAADMGNAQASFALAETYDPHVLSKWGTYGTRGDANKALDLYAKALAGGITEAKERSDALRR